MDALLDQRVAAEPRMTDLARKGASLALTAIAHEHRPCSGVCRSHGTLVPSPSTTRWSSPSKLTLCVEGRRLSGCAREKNWRRSRIGSEAWQVAPPGTEERAER